MTRSTNSSSCLRARGTRAFGWPLPPESASCIVASPCRSALYIRTGARRPKGVSRTCRVSITKSEVAPPGSSGAFNAPAGALRAPLRDAVLPLARQARALHQLGGGAGAIDGVEDLGAGDLLETRVAQGLLVQLEDDALGGVDPTHGRIGFVEPGADFGRERVETRQIGRRPPEAIELTTGHGCELPRFFGGAIVPRDWRGARRTKGRNAAGPPLSRRERDGSRARG